MSKQDNTPELVRKLVCAFLKTSPGDPATEKVFNYAMRILGSRISPSLVKDQSHLEDLIKRQLIKEKGTPAAMTFANLVTKLKSKNILNHYWSILYTLYSVSQQPYFTTTDKNSLFLSELSPSSISLGGPSADQLKKNKIQTEALLESLPLAKSTAKQQATGTVARPNEMVLVRDMLFVLQAMDGNYVKFSQEHKRFVLLPTVDISKALVQVVERLADIGTTVHNINAYLNSCEGKDGTHNGVDSGGLVKQAFNGAVRNEMLEYQRLLTLLHIQFKNPPPPQEGQPSTPAVTLRRLFVWMQEPLNTLNALQHIIQTIQKTKGGEALSGIYKQIDDGDPHQRALVNRLITNSWEPIATIIRNWLKTGQLMDPHNEFFVGNRDVAPALLWQHMFYLRVNMIPSFIPLALANKILLVGKSINFMAKCCQYTDWEHDVAINKFDLWEGEKEKNSKGPLGWEEKTGVEGASVIERLEEFTKKAEELVNKKLMSLMFEKYNLGLHLQAIKNYLLCGQGDFIQYFMDLLWSELSKPAHTVYRHNLIGQLESAIRGSNAQYEPEFIQRRLDISLIKGGNGESGWDVFFLKYEVHPPESVIFSEDTLALYHKVFAFLWKLKRAEYSLSRARGKRVFGLDKKSGLGRVMHVSSLLASEMSHFLVNLQYYVMFEALESSWHDFMAEMSKTQDLDSLIEAHKRYLHNILERSLLLDTCSSMMAYITGIFELIIKFTNLQQQIYSTAEIQISKHNLETQAAYEKSLQGKWGLTDTVGGKKSPAPSDADTGGAPVHVVLAQQLDGISKEYHKLFKKLKFVLQSEQITFLKFLSFRLDFNEFYEKKAAPLTSGVL